MLGDVLGLANRRPLRVDSGHVGAVPAGCGLGRVGCVGATTLWDLVQCMKVALGLAHVLVAGSVDRIVERVAVCVGSGGDLLGDAMAAGADVIVTGELRHHDALRATAMGLAVVCTLHSVSERPALVSLARSLQARLPGVSIAVSASDCDPFVIC